MDHQAFRDQVNSALRGFFADKIHQHLNQRFEAYKLLVRHFSALDDKYDDNQTIIQDGLPGIFNAIAKEQESEKISDFSQIYLNAIEEVIEKFPVLEMWDQSEERFLPADEDPFLLSVGKHIKNSVRTTSHGWHSLKQRISELFGHKLSPWKSWQHEIPLQRIVKYHLLSDKIVRELIYKLERFQVELLTDIENLIVAACRDEETLSIGELADSLQQKLNNYKSELQNQIEETLSQPEKEILDIAPKVGTMEKRTAFYSKARLSERTKKVEKSLYKTHKQWSEALSMLLDHCRAMSQFYILQTDIQNECDVFLKDFHSYFQDNLEEPFQELYHLLIKAFSKVKGGANLQVIQNVKEELGNFVGDQIIPPIDKLQQEEVLSRKVEHLFEQLLMRANEASSQVPFLFDMDLEQNPPVIKQKQIEWRLLIVRTIREQIMADIQPSTQEYEDFLAICLEELEEIESVITINLESAIDAAAGKNEQEGNPAEIVQEALQRLLHKVENLQSQYQKKWEGIEQVIQEGEKNFRQSLLSLLHGGDTQALQLINAKYRVRETTKSWQGVLDSRWVRAQDRLALWGRFGWQKSKKYVKEVRRFVGFKEEKVAESYRADIATYLSETDQKLKELPYIYRRLFNFDAKADQRFYVSRNDTVAVLEKAFKQWQQSFPATVAVIGEKGSGKSTFLNLSFDTKFGEFSVHQIELRDTIWSEKALVELFSQEWSIPEAKTMNDVIEFICNKDKKRLVILEGIQNCFIRNVNGYEAMEKLSYLIAETKDQIFWVVSCSRYAWRFWDKIESISEYFSHVIRTDTLDADQIEKVIMNRHRASGYSLKFEVGDSILRSRAYRKLDKEEEVQKFLRKNYFSKLAEISEGNASIAMIFWIRSIQNFDDTCFYIKPLEVTSIEMIEDLSAQVLFTLAAFVMHDTISDTDLSMILNLSQEESRLMLIRLYSRGLLTEINGYYLLNHLMYRQVVRVLKERNIIHLV